MNTFQTFLTRNGIIREISRHEKKTCFLENKERQAKKQKEELRKCIFYLKNILETHSRETTPLHTSGDYLLFFIGENNQVALIEELSPSKNLMPDMQRISFLNVKRRPLKTNGEGFLIERVYFGTDSRIRTAERFVICLERMLVEEF